MGVKGYPELESGKSGHYYLDSKRMKKDEVAAQQEIYLYEFVEKVKSSAETMAVLPQMLKVLEKDPGLSKYCQSKPKVVPKCEQVLEFGEGWKTWDRLPLNFCQNMLEWVFKHNQEHMEGLVECRDKHNQCIKQLFYVAFTLSAKMQIVPGYQDVDNLVLWLQERHNKMDAPSKKGLGKALCVDGQIAFQHLPGWKLHDTEQTQDQVRCKRIVYKNGLFTETVDMSWMQPTKLEDCKLNKHYDILDCTFNKNTAPKVAQDLLSLLQQQGKQFKAKIEADVEETWKLLLASHDCFAPIASPQKTTGPAARSSSTSPPQLVRAKSSLVLVGPSKKKRRENPISPDKANTNAK